jgi:hypothetical protein
MQRRGSQKGILLGRVTPVPVVNVASYRFVDQVQGPIVTKLGDLYAALPVLVIPALVFFGSRNITAAFVTMGFIATLTPFATLKLLGLIKT